jgi:hypothetical protein
MNFIKSLNWCILEKKVHIIFLKNVFNVEFYEHVEQFLVWVKFSLKSKLKLKFWKWNDSKRF